MMPPVDKRNPSAWKKYYSRILFAAVVLSVVYYIVDTGKDISRYDYRLDWWYVSLSFIFIILAYLAQLFIWIRLADAFGLQAPFFSAAKAWSLSQLGKYMPGKLGMVLVRFEVYAGASKRKITVATGVEFITSMAASCLLVLLALIFFPEKVPPSIRWTAALAAVIFLVALYPPILKGFTALIFRLIKRAPLTELPTYGLLLKLVGVHMLVGLPYGLGLFFSFKCFHPVGWEYFLTIAGVYYAAALIGVAAIFAPAGIGVREGIVFLVLPAFLPNPVVIFATILSRVLMTVSEICLALLFMATYRLANIKLKH